MINWKASNYKKHNALIIFIVIFIQYNVTNVSAQNNLPQLQNSVKPNPAPSAPGDIFQPVMSGTPVANAPAFAEWTKTAGADESIVVTGINFSRYSGLQEGKDTRFFLYSHNFSRDERIQRQDGNKAMLTLDSSLPDWSMYLIWPGNEAGYGYPAAINKTDAWWIGPDKATAGSTVAVYGRNLSHNNDSLLSYIYLKSASGPAQWLNVKKVNPYKVEFDLPSGLPDGNYEVWTHNGHGGDYGWSGPLMLTVYTAPQWTNTIFNVKNYGATPDDGTDDTGPIRNAIRDASFNPYSTVYFPAGTYIFSDLLSLGDNMRWKGDGKNVSILKSVVNFVPSATNMVLSTSQNVEITDMGFDGSNINVVNNIDKPFFFRNSTDLKLKNLSFNFPTFDVLDFNHAYRVFISNCSIIGQSSFLGDCSQLFIDSCSFKLTNDAELALFSWGGVGVSLTNSTCSDFDNSNPDDSSGWGKGRFYVGSGVQGSNWSTYLAYNTTTDLTVRPNADQNSGEQFLWEGNETKLSATPISATPTTITFSNIGGISGNLVAAVTSGTGIGQMRRIISYSGNTLGLDQPWNVIPDNTSVIDIGPYTDKVAIYKNYFDGKPYAVTNTDHIASVGIEPYGGMFNLVADRNTMHEVRYGISNWATDDGVHPEPNYFNLFVNNLITNTRWAINMAPIMSGNISTATILGSVFRGNIIENIAISGITTTLVNTPAGINTTNIFEHNSFNGVPKVYETLPDGTENQLFYHNDFASTAFTTSVPALQITSKIALQKNRYRGFTVPYTGSLTNDIIEAPYHVIQLKGVSGGKIIDSVFGLLNSGISAFGWNITNNTTWLTLNPVSGVISDERQSDSVQLHANPSGLLPGTYTATMNVTSGAGNKFYTVLFSVGSIPLPLKLIDFKATVIGSIVLLQWKTQDELNTRDFNVEHSINGFSWQNIGVVKAAGFGSANYKMNHLDPSVGINYYRLKENDLNGQFTYSEIRSIEINEEKSLRFILIPNPAANNTTLYFSRPIKSPQVNVYDESGRLLISVKTNGLLSSYSLETHILTEGNYFITVKNEAAFLTAKLQIR